MKPVWWVMFVAAIACSGCSDKGAQKAEKTPAEIEKEYKPKLEARLAKLFAAKQAAQTNERVVGEPGDSNVVLTLPGGAGSAGAVPPNTIMADAEDLETVLKQHSVDLEKENPLPQFLFDDDNQVYQARLLVGPEKGAKAEYVPRYEELLAAKYVLVVFTGDVQFGAAVGSFEQFMPFKVSGTAILTEIETAKPLGGFRYEATNSPEIKTTTYKSSGRSDAMQVLRTDFAEQFRAALKAGIQTRWPGST